MSKKDLIVPFLVVGLTLLFAGISVAVFLSNGKSKKWVARKMKIGGLLLTLTAVSCNGGGEVMCYDTVAPNSMWLHANTEKGIEINLDTNNVLIGDVSERDAEDLSFLVKDEKDNKVQQGLLLPIDGKFDQRSESFKIELNKDLAAGNYSLNLYACGIEKQDSAYYQYKTNLTIKNE